MTPAELVAAQVEQLELEVAERIDLLRDQVRAEVLREVRDRLDVELGRAAGEQDGRSGEQNPGPSERKLPKRERRPALPPAPARRDRIAARAKQLRPPKKTPRPTTRLKAAPAPKRRHRKWSDEKRREVIGAYRKAKASGVRGAVTKVRDKYDISWQTLRVWDRELA